MKFAHSRRVLISALARALAVALAFAMSSSLPAAETGSPASPAERLLASTRPLVIGHRGYAAVAPENSLVSFDRALAAGVDLVELDYHHASDGLPVVIHDGTLDRTTDALARWGGKGKDLPVHRRPSADLVTLDIGSWYQPPYPGQKLPTLEAALSFIQARGVTLIERKGGDPTTLARLLADRKLVNQVVVQSFDWSFLRGLHALEPRQVLGALGPPGQRDGRKLTDAEKALNPGWLREIKALGARAAVWNKLVDRAAVAEAHRLGLRVWVYTINDADLAASLLALGVDGLITDNPALAWRAVALSFAAPRP